MAITSIYLSSTFEDLESYRRVVGTYLRKLNKQVIGMEDYVASDQRPLDKCLEDVAKSDVYIGIFAHRYGYIPENDNPGSRSITELEYRHALKCGKPTLIFLVDKHAAWPPLSMDHYTGEGENGKRIDALLEELSKEKTASFFQSDVELAALVNTAVMNLEATKPVPPVAAGAVRNTPENRQITSDLFITYGAPDEAQVRALASEFQPDPDGMSSLLSAGDLFAKREADFLRLDLQLQTCDVAIAVLSQQTLRQMRRIRLLCRS